MIRYTVNTCIKETLQTSVGVVHQTSNTQPISNPAVRCTDGLTALNFVGADEFDYRDMCTVHMAMCRQRL